MLRHRLQRNIQETSASPSWERTSIGYDTGPRSYCQRTRVNTNYNFDCKYRYKWKLQIIIANTNTNTRQITITMYIQGPDLSLVSDPDSGFGGPGALWICHLKEIGFQLKYHFAIWRNRILSSFSLSRGPSPPSHILLFLLSRVRQWFWLLSHKITTQVTISLSHHLTISSDLSQEHSPSHHLILHLLSHYITISSVLTQELNQQVDHLNSH